MKDNEHIPIEHILGYVFALFQSTGYRSRYAEFLIRDFPRLPLTSSDELFASLAGKGRELADVYLMRSPRLDEFITDFPMRGDYVVTRVA